jgi:argonaute-like protein implicated in RNA metabolism and viral defense
VFPRWAQNEAKKLRIAFQDGMFHFRGFKSFSHGIEIEEFCEDKLDITHKASPVEQANEYRENLNNLKESFSDTDLAFVVLPTSAHFSTDAPYAAAKIFFARQGIPSQMIGLDKIRNDYVFKWSLRNMALACYAKLGNIPWVIEDRGISEDLIIGFGKREFRQGRVGKMHRYFGFTTAYRNNGAFVTFQGLSPSRTETDLGAHLEKAIVEALRQYASQQKKIGNSNLVPEQVVLHSFKRIGNAEADAVREAVQYVSNATDKEISYLLIHIEDSESLYIFDTGDRTYLPQAGQVVKLGYRQSLLLTEGRERYDKRKIGFPHPYRVTMDKRSKVGSEDYELIFENALDQILGLSKMNWRGFNAAAIPVTLNYSRLLAEVVGFCRNDAEWQEIVDRDELKDKAWFL